jgi:hypothetical protein
MIFSVYESILHLKKLEDENKITDDKWEYIKSIIVYRLMHYNSDFSNYSNIGIRSVKIHSNYCLFELFHRQPKHRYLFIVHKSTDNLLPLACKDKNNKLLKIYIKKQLIFKLLS